MEEVRRRRVAHQARRAGRQAPWGRGATGALTLLRSATRFECTAGRRVLHEPPQPFRARAPPLLRKGVWGRLRPQAFPARRVFARAGGRAALGLRDAPPVAFCGGAPQRFGFGCAQGFARSEPEPKRGGRRWCVPMRLRRAASRSGFPLWENLIGFGATRWRSGRTVRGTSRSGTDGRKTLCAALRKPALAQQPA